MTVTMLETAIAAAHQRFTDHNPKSLALHREATNSLPGGNTRTLLHGAPFPVYMKRGEGWGLESEDGRVYTDLAGDLSAGLYGHSHPLIHKTLHNTLSSGLNLGATTTHESRHASLICSRLHLSRIRFTNSGTEANLHALAGARHFTARRTVVVFSGAYHGGCFSFVSGAPSANTVDRGDWLVGRYNDAEDAKRIIEDPAHELAAVLVEAVQGSGPAIVGSREFLQQGQSSARKVGALFILDEVMTSRLAPGGIAEVLGLQPDMTTLGKWLGGGITFGAFGGREEVMRVYDPRVEGGLSHSGTFNNNTLGLAAGYVGLKEVYTPEVCVEFNKMGDRFRKRLEALSQGTKMTVTGRGSMIGIHWLVDRRKELLRVEDKIGDNQLKELFWFEMLEEGFWLTRFGKIAMILGTPQSELDRFVEAVERFLGKYGCEGITMETRIC